MGCDYYIEQRLCIYKDDSSYYISLSRERGYYTDWDEFMINVNIENSNLTEWEKMLDSIMINNHCKTWNDIKDIVILEKRYTRD